VSSQHGQASIEWVGLVLLVALVLGALLSLAPRPQGPSLGHALAGTLTCPARSACVSQRTAAVTGLPPPRAAPSRVAPERAAAAFRALRGVTTIAKRAWIACLGWKRYRYELRHPEVTIPGRTMPLREALRIANDCLNPLNFTTEGT